MTATAAALAVLTLAALPTAAQGATRRECGRVSLPKGYTAKVNVEGAGCTTARIVVRDNMRKRILRQTGGTGITRKNGWRCKPVHGDETMCTKGDAVAFGYALTR